MLAWSPSRLGGVVPAAIAPAVVRASPTCAMFAAYRETWGA